MAAGLVGFVFELIMDVVGGIFDGRERKQRVAQGKFFGGLRVRSGTRPGVSKYDIRTGYWRIETGRMRLEEVDIRGIELMPDTRRMATDQEHLGFVHTEFAIRTIRTRAAELEWFVPVDIEDDAVAALLGQTVVPQPDDGAGELPAAQDL